MGPWGLALMALAALGECPEDRVDELPDCLSITNLFALCHPVTGNPVSILFVRSCLRQLYASWPPSQIGAMTQESSMRMHA